MRQQQQHKSCRSSGNTSLELLVGHRQEFTSYEGRGEWGGGGGGERGKTIAFSPICYLFNMDYVLVENPGSTLSGILRDKESSLLGI